MTRQAGRMPLQKMKCLASSAVSDTSAPHVSASYQAIPSLCACSGEIAISEGTSINQGLNRSISGANSQQLSYSGRFSRVV